MGSFIEEACARIREQVGDQKVVLGLSGGVDSSVTAALLHKAIGDQLTCIFVNNGLLRSREEEIVQRVFGENFHVRLKYVDASERFLALLKGVTDPETKRKIIGNEFIKVFQHATEELLEEDSQKWRCSKHGGYKFLAQGTLYPDVIESVSIEGNPAQVIKSHHNVGGLPEKCISSSSSRCASYSKTKCARPVCSSVCRKRLCIVSLSRARSSRSHSRRSHARAIVDPARSRHDRCERDGIVQIGITASGSPSLCCCRSARSA